MQACQASGIADGAQTVAPAGIASTSVLAGPSLVPGQQAEALRSSVGSKKSFLMHGNQPRALSSDTPVLTSGGILNEAGPFPRRPLVC